MYQKTMWKNKKEHSSILTRFWNQFYLLRYSRKTILKLIPSLFLILIVTNLTNSIRRTNRNGSGTDHATATSKFSSSFLDNAKHLAIVLPVHEPKFSFLYRFYNDLQNCPAASTNTQYYFLFSNKREQDSFWTDLPPPSKSSSDNDNIESLLREKVTSLIVPEWTLINYAAGDKAQGSTIPIAKKWWGMAWLADQVTLFQTDPSNSVLTNPIDFILAIDAETKLTNCDLFSSQSLLQGLVQKYKEQRWIAGPMEIPNIINRIGAEYATADMDKLFKLYEQTNHWKVYSWWTDLPWYEMRSLMDMFESWKDRPWSDDDMTEDVKHELLHDPSRSFQTSVQHFNPARSWYAFEHIVYQSYMIAYYDFKFVIKTVPKDQVFCGGALLECHYQSDSKVLPDWSPLWVPGHMANYQPEKGLLPFYLFHTDRFSRAK